MKEKNEDNPTADDAQPHDKNPNNPISDDERQLENLIADIGVLKKRGDTERNTTTRLNQLLAGKVRPEFARKLLEGIGETREAIDKIMATVEQEREKLFSFAEAAAALADKLDLKAARNNATESHNRYGLVGLLVKAGLIQTTDKYVTLFDKATISEADLKKVLEDLGKGKNAIPVFTYDAGPNLSEDQKLTFNGIMKQLGTASTGRTKTPKKEKPLTDILLLMS
jgi:hypothetical protein